MSARIITNLETQTNPLVAKRFINCHSFPVAFLEEHFGEWKPASRGAIIAWLVAYSLFLLYAALSRSGFLFVDYVNLIIHEGGHFFFSWFGYIITIFGGTLAELLVPLLCTAYFFWRRELTGFAFSLFWFFENFLYIGVYMADARAQNLPLVGSGEHDWEILFSYTRLLNHGQQIGHATCLLGWLGMFAVLACLATKLRPPAPQLHPLPD